jgi:hypothetical protein
MNPILTKKNIYHGVEEELHGGHGVLRGGELFYARLS